MGKIHLDRLRSRHGYSNEKYRALIEKILAENSRMVQNRVLEITSKEWSNRNRAVHMDARMVLPTVESVLPGKSVQAMKSAEQGELITDTLRDAITSKLRARLKQYAASPRAKVQPHIISDFESDLRGVYRGYTRGGKGELPPNIHAIAVTEVRVPIAEIKYRYNRALLHKNPGFVMEKTWVHNSRLSKVPRPGHQQLNGKTIPFDAHFKVNSYRFRGGRWFRTGTDRMLHPHDGSAPAGQVINCSCDCIYTVRRKRR